LILKLQRDTLLIRQLANIGKWSSTPNGLFALQSLAWYGVAPFGLGRSRGIKSKGPSWLRWALVRGWQFVDLFCRDSGIYQTRSSNNSFDILIIGSCKLNSMVTLTVELNEELANALAQFFKRVGFAEMRCNAVDDAEAYLIRDAIDRVRMGLANAGFSPR
jgi:hypothetical protein